MFDRIKLQTGFMLVYCAVILLFIFVIYLYINQFVLRAYEKTMINNSLQYNIKLSEQVDLYFNDLNQLSKNSVYNQNLMDDMRELDRLTHELTQYENLFFDRSFESYSSYLLNYSDLNTSKVYIYGRQNRFKFAYGSLPLQSNFETVYNDPLLREQLSGRAIVHINNSNTSEESVVPSISVIRSFSEISGYVLGYIEIQQDYAVLDKIANLGSTGKMYIIDANDQVVYPPNQLDAATLQLIHDVKNNYNTGLTKDSFFYTAHKSIESGLTTIVEHSRDSVFKPLYSLKNMTIAAIIAVCLLSIIAIYLLTKRMTEPIRKLRSSILKVDFDNFSLFTNRKSPSNEVNMLNEAFQQMMERLRSSMDMELIAQQEELKARFSALQAQIAPHFIHNILYLISISAEEERNEDVIKMCKQLSNMLRYMAESPFQNVTLKEDLKYTMNYLALIEYKYENFISFNIDVNEDASSVIIPRLTIQPFVENMIQHAFNEIDPPWRIHISCKIIGQEWLLVIKDNGSGITPQALETLHLQIQDILASDHTAYDQSSGIGGLGILNTVMRLKILYPETLRFSLESSETGVTITIQASTRPHQ